MIKREELIKKCYEQGIKLPSGYISKQKLFELLNIQKKEKDPNRPKKNNSVFFKFCKDNKTKFPTLNQRERNKKLGVIWTEHKEKEDKIYKKYMEEFEKEAIKYKKEAIKYKKTLKIPRPTTTFFLFSKEIRQTIKDENPDLSTIEITKKIGKKWKKLSKEEQKIYEKKYKNLIEKQKKEYEPFKLFKQKERTNVKKEFPNFNKKEIEKELTKRFNSTN